MIAGSKPDKTPTATVNETRANSQTGLPNTFISTRVCNKSLTNGTTASARRTPIIKEINVSKVDSSIKRMNNSPREDPKRRRVAISFALKPAFVGELKGLSCVDRVGKTQGLPLFGSNNWTATYQGQNISFQQFVMDKECYDMLGLEILRDNHLTTEGWFLNEQAMREMNLSEDAASFMLDRQERPIAIAGIVRDFYCFGNVTTGMNPVMFRFLKDNEDPWMILIETQGDPFAAKEAIGKVYEKVTGLEFEAYFMDERLQNSFDSQIRLAKIVIVFSIIAILISLLGLLAMSTYFIQQRSQEVSVRKVFGSSNREILVKLVFTFLNYVLIAFVIAIPIIMYFMKDWLSDYSYRISLSPLIFIAAGLFCLVISFVSVFFQSYRAATSNPVDSFRHRL